MSVVTLSGERLSVALAVKGLTQQQLAKQAGVDSHSVGKAIKGQPIRSSTAAKIVQAIELAPSIAATLGTFLLSGDAA